MKIVIFDTETTGLLKPDNSPLEAQPKIIEFYGVAVNEDFEILDEVNEFIYPGEPVSKEITRITGIKDSDLKGKPEFGHFAERINNLFKDADLSVAHNIAFDNGMLEVEMKRLDMIRNLAVHDLCTVNHLLPIYGYRISLSALYKKLFNTFFKAHRAKNDVFALITIFHKLIENGEIDLELYKNGIQL